MQTLSHSLDKCEKIFICLRPLQTCARRFFYILIGYSSKLYNVKYWILILGTSEMGFNMSKKCHLFGIEINNFDFSVYNQRERMHKMEFERR